ncbi:MAG: DNA repair protein RadC [Spirochaetales bacterium]|jgi:DNA repair protein RadC|nr:DNA repair protein RadC [Spirochaetales bacterium]
MKHLFVMEKMSALPAEQRPRERLITFGVKSLSDQELLAILIGSGNKSGGVQRIAASVLDLLDRTNADLTPEALTALPGVGTAKATLILAALEFSRRRLCPAHRKIAFPKDILPLIDHFADRNQEYFLCASLNGAHEVIACRVVSVGLVNKALVHPREVFADPLSDRAAAVIIAHNHPSGNFNPSGEDRDITVKIRNAAKVLGIHLLDHIIFGRGGYYSFLENGEL